MPGVLHLKNVDEIYYGFEAVGQLGGRACPDHY
jgi:hypothetical protein